MAEDNKYNEDFYKLSSTDNKGQEYKFDQLRDKVVLIVNVASRCGFTSQYEGLETLYKKYQSQGFVVLGFPCNQFANQEPGDNEDIAQFCQKRNVTFPIMDKSNVNGDKTNPVFAYLKKQAPGILKTTYVKWNFTKFLVDRHGNNIVRYGPRDAPETIEPKIQEYINAN